MSGGISATTVMMMAAAAVSAVGAIQAGQAQQDQANAQAQETLNQGAYKADAAKAMAEKIRKAGTATQGEANASLAASGVKLGEGTALEVQKTIKTNVEEDALSAILSGKRASDSADQEAKLLGKAGDNAVTSSYFQAGSTVLGAAAKGSYYNKVGWKATATGTGEP